MPNLYDIILCGEDIFFENHETHAITGFLTCRRVAAESADEAIIQAKHQVLIHWNQSYNADRRLGVPALSVARVSEVKRWINRQPDQDYYFFDSPDNKAAHQSNLEDSSRPWYRLSTRS